MTKTSRIFIKFKKVILLTFSVEAVYETVFRCGREKTKCEDKPVCRELNIFDSSCYISDVRAISENARIRKISKAIEVNVKSELSHMFLLGLLNVESHINTVLMIGYSKKHVFEFLLY